MLPLLFLLAAQTGDTLTIRSIPCPPSPDTAIDSARFGPPQVRLRTGQGTALVWLLRSADTVFVAASIPDSTFYWGDDFVLSLDRLRLAYPRIWLHIASRWAGREQ